MHQQSLIITLLLITLSNCQLSLKNDLKSKFAISTAPSLLAAIPNENSTPCSCAVFLSGQFKKGSQEQPKGHPALIQETETTFPCTPTGTKMCINKCLESIVKHLPNSPAIICGTIDRDCHRERAYLWVQNCDATTWTNSNLSAGREYCCKSGEPQSCLKVWWCWSESVQYFMFNFLYDLRIIFVIKETFFNLKKSQFRKKV